MPVGEVAGEKADELAELLGEVIVGKGITERRSAAAVAASVPGARPMPRSILPG